MFTFWATYVKKLGYFLFHPLVTLPSEFHHFVQVLIKL